MNIRQLFQTALRNLLANRLRSLQCMLAMVIGVAGVVVVLGVGSSLVNLNARLDSEYAPGLISTFVSIKADNPKTITLADMEQVMQDKPDIISAISPFVYMDFISQLRVEDKLFANPEVMGVNDSYLTMYPALKLREGRFLQYMDCNREQRVCVVGNDIARELFNGNALGQTLKILGENFTVVGVTEEVPFSAELNVCLFIPYTTANKMVGENIDSLGYIGERYYVLANGEENMYETTILLQEMIEQRMGVPGGFEVDGAAWSFSAFAFSHISSLMQGAMYTYIFFGLMAAGVVLFIGGVGIMNVMLAAVGERTKEIGIRKAFGATNKHIRQQFTMEAIITSVIGGLLGVLVGVVVILLFGLFEITIPVNGGYPYPVRLVDMNFLTFGLPALLVLLLCVGIGVFFSAYPAQQAAKMEPVQAINEN